MNLITKSRTFKVLVLFVAVVATVLISGEQCSNQWETVLAGSRHSLGFMKNGSLLAWGRNGYGQFGTGKAIEAYYEPVLIKEGAKWLQITTCSSSTFGILHDGTLWGWGQNEFGQLGDGTYENRGQPVQIGTDNDWIMVSSGYHHTLALKKDGSLWVFGNGDSGQLGIKAEKKRLLKPTRIQADHKWVKVFAGQFNSFAIREDGTLWGWGANKCGQLGDNSTEDKLSPVQIAPQIKWKEISSGDYHTLGLDVEGNLYAWGRNIEGALGDGTQVAKLIPTRIGHNKWKSISARYMHSVGLMEDGTLFAWGSNSDGQLGDGTTQTRASPVQIGKGFIWKSVSVGFWHTIAVTNEGHMMAWGENKGGQLGNTDETKKMVLEPSLCSGGGGFCFRDKCESSCPEGSFEISKICYKCEERTYFNQKTKTCVSNTGILVRLWQYIMKKLQ